jgi:hypothetical protein
MDAPPNTSQPISGSQAGAAFVLLLIAMFIAAWFAPAGWNWLFVMILLAVFAGILGKYVTNYAAGIFINNLNIMSLSRFQMVLWTVIVLSAYFTMALIRVKSAVDDPLAVEIDWHLWALLGISTTSLVGTPLLQGGKKTKKPATSKIQETANFYGQGETEVNKYRQGLLYGNPDPKDAKLSDMFQGDEIGNTAHVDLPKLQMFFFTVIAAFAYCVILFNTLVAAQNDGSILQNLPILPDGFIAILGISHAGYLTSKGTDHTPTETK